MKRLLSFRRPVRTLVLSALVLASPAMARMPDPSHLTRCHSTIAADVTCRLPVKNDTFDSLGGWTALGEVSIKTDAGNRFVSIGYGSAIQQPVYAYFYKGNKATYALRFRVRSDAADAQVQAALYMSDDTGQRTVPIGSTTATVGGDGWSVVELVAGAKPYAAPAHVLVEITKVEGEGAIDVDDVYLVESADAEVIDAR